MIHLFPLPMRMRRWIDVALGILGNTLFAFLAWLIGSWEGAIFLGIFVLCIACWWFRSHPIIHLAFNWFLPAGIPIMAVLLPQYVYSDWAACAAPFLPQPNPPCLVTQARRVVSSIVYRPDSGLSTWYKSSIVNGNSEVASTFDESFTGEEDFVTPSPVIRSFWKSGHLVARDELPPKQERRYAWVRFYYHNGCVIAADYMGTSYLDTETVPRSIALGWDPKCGDVSISKSSGGNGIAVPAPIFLPSRY
jgi:hypothetical protein